MPEKAPQKARNPNVSRFWQRFRRNRVGFAASIIMLGIILVTAAAPMVANDRPIIMNYKGSWYLPAFLDYRPAELQESGFVVDYLALEPKIAANGWALWPPIKQRPNEPNLNFETVPAPPGASTVVGRTADYAGLEINHVLGTDTAGRDLVTRLIYGCRTSLLMATLITALSLVMGATLGALMGYFGGLFDLLFGRLLEALGYFPVIFMIIVLVAFLETPGLGFMALVFAVLGLSPFAFYMRGQVLMARKMTYVEAAKALGQTDLKVMLRHILPNSLSPILVLIPFTITANISFLATIDFLGFGVQPPTSSLGAILRSGYDNVAERWWLVLYSSIVLVVILLLVNFIGDAIRDGLDPKASIDRRAFKRWVTAREAAARATQPPVESP